MEEDNGIKIKANVIYSIVMFPMIGIFVYFEAVGIKRLIAGIELGATLFELFVIHLVSVSYTHLTLPTNSRV